MSDIVTSYDRTATEVTITRRPCLCGCGEMPTRPTAEFVPGHDARYKSQLIAAHLAGVTITITDGEDEREATPMELATERDWDPYLLLADRRKEREAAAKAEKARKAS